MAKRPFDPSEFALPPVAPRPGAAKPKEAVAVATAPPFEPPAPDPALRRFVAGKPASKLRRDEPGERLVLNVPPELARRLRIACAEDRQSLSNAAAEAIEAWLARRPT